MTYLVTGGTGTVGGHLLRLAAADGTPVRALVRDPARAAAVLPAGVDTVAGDLGDTAAVDRALDGVTAAFLAVGGTPDQQALEEHFVDRAAHRGVRTVKLSAFGAAPGSPVPYDRWHAAVEARLAAGGAPWTVLRPTVFLQNLLGSAGAVAAGRLPAPAGDARVAQIDARDIAAVALLALVGDGHTGRTYDLTGPAALTYADVAAACTDVLGHHVGYVDLPAGSFGPALRSSGLPGWQADALTALMATIRSGAQQTVTDTVPRLLGRPARDVRTFLADHRAAFTAS